MLVEPRLQRDETQQRALAVELGDAHKQTQVVVGLAVHAPSEALVALQLAVALVDVDACAQRNHGALRDGGALVDRSLSHRVVVDDRAATQELSDALVGAAARLGRERRRGR